MGSDANRRQWAVSHIEGLYFLGKDGILPITNHCNPMLSVCQMAAICFNDLMCAA